MFNGPKRLFKRSLQDMAVGNVLNLKRDMSSLASAWHLSWHNLHQVDRLATFGVYHNLFFSFILFIYFDAHINGGQICWCSYQWRSLFWRSYQWWSYILTLISMAVMYFDTHINGGHILWCSYQWGSYSLTIISMAVICFDTQSIEVIYFDTFINGGHPNHQFCWMLAIYMNRYFISNYFSNLLFIQILDENHYFFASLMKNK